ncbi:hypothetical protein [Comamonas antarctica]|uniref:Uncharacterized protein n=1 Tax=Comamonas antarctica TaxID=2743470 RepID=A0A6N1X573_9BURK|nr:hypothetical protein [Comamonas antarctica]QKV52940.1 hypothetical protein HUK68_08595 [Comamonas antarctica]
MEILEELKFFWATNDPAGSRAGRVHVAFFRGKDSTRAPRWDLPRDGFVTGATPAHAVGAILPSDFRIFCYL